MTQTLEEEFAEVGDEEIEPEFPQPLIELWENRKRIPNTVIDGFDFRKYLDGFPIEKVHTAEGRREITKDDPLAFALVYLIHHLASAETGGHITFAQLHVGLIRDAKNWQRGVGGLRELRDAYIAPRGSGKTTWLFLILPLWRAAHEYSKFIVAYSDSIEQARLHLDTFRAELDDNDVLKWDFPELCAPAIRATTNRLVSARSDKIQQANGFAFVAKGMTSASLGIKIGKRRPDFIILDDIEPGEEKYSEAAAQKRLGALQSKIFYQNENARVVLVGTVTMVGSIIHQLVESALHPSDDTPVWIADEGFRVHYFPPILTADDGTQSSCWPNKWPLSYLLMHEHERDYQKNFENQPVNEQGDYWTTADIQHLGDRDFFGIHTLLQIDPAVKSSWRSHYTGIAVVTMGSVSGDGERQCLIRHMRKVKLSPKKLRILVLNMLEDWPEIGLVRVEDNQGGDTWLSVFYDLPVRVTTHFEDEPKEYRTVRALSHYQRGRVLHEKKMREFEMLLTSFPNVTSDDEIDAMTAAVDYFLKKPKPRRRMGLRRRSYV